MLCNIKLKDSDSVNAHGDSEQSLLVILCASDFPNSSGGVKVYNKVRVYFIIRVWMLS